MMPLAPADLTRLARICGMLGSDHDGERAAAALKADAIVRGGGVTWSELFGRPNLPTPRSSKTAWRRELSPASLLALYGPALTGWERNFLATLAKRESWTNRQREVLAGIQGRFK